MTGSKAPALREHADSFAPGAAVRYSSGRASPFGARGHAELETHTDGEIPRFIDRYWVRLGKNRHLDRNHSTSLHAAPSEQ